MLMCALSAVATSGFAAPVGAFGGTAGGVSPRMSTTFCGLAAPLMAETRNRARVARLSFAWADEMLAARDVPPDQLADLVDRFRSTLGAI